MLPLLPICCRYNFASATLKILIYQGFQRLVADVTDNITNKYKSNNNIYKTIYIGVWFHFGNNGNKNSQKPHNDGLCGCCQFVTDSGNKYI